MIEMTWSKESDATNIDEVPLPKVQISWGFVALIEKIYNEGTFSLLAERFTTPLFQKRVLCENCDASRYGSRAWKQLLYPVSVKSIMWKLWRIPIWIPCLETITDSSFREEYYVKTVTYPDMDPVFGNNYICHPNNKNWLRWIVWGLSLDGAWTDFF